MTLSKYALMQQPSIGPFDTLFIYYILLILVIKNYLSTTNCLYMYMHTVPSGSFPLFLLIAGR